MENITELSKRPLIACHRGKSGGNIIENTVLSAKCAICEGADIVEFDVAKSIDGKLFVFHTGMEYKLYPFFFPIRLRTAKNIKKSKLYNNYMGNSNQAVNTLEEYLDALKDKCYLNLDRIWCGNVKKVLECLHSKGMDSQIIIKTQAHNRDIPIMREIAKYKDLTYIGIVRSEEQLDRLVDICDEIGLKISGLEVIFKSEDSYFASKDFFVRCAENGWMTWANAITLNGRPDMCANHGDNISIEKSFDEGWGYLIKKGYDIIQTDWPGLLSKYIEKK